MPTQQKMIDLAIANLMGVFNERDQTKRLEAMQSSYEPSVILYDPNDALEGFSAISGFVDKLLDASPEWSFGHTGTAWINHDLVTMEWMFGPREGKAVVKGNDVMLVDPSSGKIAKVWTMIEGQSNVMVEYGHVE